MNDQNKVLILFVSLEGKESYSEINMFEGFRRCILNYHHKDEEKIQNIITPIAIDGNKKNKEEFFNYFKEKIEKMIEIDIQEKINKNYKIKILCIWDELKEKNNILENFKFIKSKLKDWSFEKLVFEKGLEMGFINYFLKEPCKNISELQQKFKYSKKEIFKKKENKKIFYDSMKQAKIEMDQNFLEALNKRFQDNGSNIMEKIIKFIFK